MSNDICPRDGTRLRESMVGISFCPTCRQRERNAEMLATPPPTNDHKIRELLKRGRPAPED